MKKLLSSTKFQLGFTLIELLIVIVIIVIVIGVGAASYSTVARNGRDSQRKADLKKAQLAIESFYSENGAYPNEAHNDHPSCSVALITSQAQRDDLPRSHWGKTFQSLNPSSGDCDGTTTYS